MESPQDARASDMDRQQTEEAVPAQADGSRESADYRDSSLWRWRGPVSLLGGILFALLGLLVVTAKLANGTDVALANARPAELVQILDRVESDVDRLQTQKRALQAEIDTLKSGTTEEAVAKAQARLEAMQILAGTTPVKGPGIRMVITDHDGGVDAEMVLDLMAELRDAGAESIEFAGRRVVVSTWFGDGPANGEPAINVSGDLRRPPYVVKAIGNPDTLAQAMGIPGGVADSVREAGATFQLDKRNSLTITTTVKAVVPEFAKSAS